MAPDSIDPRELQPHEVELRGTWIQRDNTAIGDSASERIDWLVANRLVRLQADLSGWDTLYQDPRDGRLWERIYPRSETHGGGPATLRVIDHVSVEAKYGHLAPRSI